MNKQSWIIYNEETKSFQLTPRKNTASLGLTQVLVLVTFESPDETKSDP